MPPPAFICVDCFDTHGMRMYDDSFVDIVLPSDHITTKCSNKVRQLLLQPHFNEVILMLLTSLCSLADRRKCNFVSLFCGHE